MFGFSVDLSGLYYKSPAPTINLHNTSALGSREPLLACFPIQRNIKEKKSNMQMRCKWSPLLSVHQTRALI